MTAKTKIAEPKICTHPIGVTAFSALRGPLIAADDASAYAMYRKRG
jgi:hypothetical protein